MQRPGRPLRRLLGALLTAAIGAAGCGPITATTSIADATVALEAARGIEAEQYAIYEYQSAVEYLRKAREEEGYSDFQRAIDLAKKARSFAEEAREKARTNPARGLPAPGEAPPVRPVAPGASAPSGGEPATGEPSGSHL